MVLLLFACVDDAVPLVEASTTRYLDCTAAEEGNGTERHPWATLARASAAHLAPGTIIELSGDCAGTFAPVSSGTPTAPLVLTGTGTLDAGGAATAIHFDGVDGWEVRDLVVSGGTTATILVDGERPGTLSHFVVDGVTIPYSDAPDGGAAITMEHGVEAVDDVTIEDTTIENVSGGDGVHLSGTNLRFAASSVRHAGGSGGWFGPAENLVVADNVVTDIGAIGSGSVGLWGWWCEGCVFRGNDVSVTTSGNLGDGGAFDIDYYTTRTTVEDNYGHDTDGYCVSIFGAGDTPISARPTVNPTIRYNVCARNSLGPAHDPDFRPEGAIYLATWTQGSIKGARIYGNTIIATPASDVPVLHEEPWHDSVRYADDEPDVFRDNLVVSDTTYMVGLSPISQLRLDHNLYWSTAGEPTFSGVDGARVDFATFQAEAQEAGSLVADPGVVAGDGVASFALPPGSPAIGAGIDPCDGLDDCEAPATDLLGVPLSSPPDLGALAFSAARVVAVRSFLEPEDRGEARMVAALAAEHPGLDVRAGTPSEARRYGPAKLVALDAEGRVVRRWDRVTAVAVLAAFGG